MANEFIARKGLIVLGNGANITGSVNVSTNVTASAFKGDGAQITGVISSSYSTTSSLATNSIVTASGAGTTITFTKGDGSTFPVTITVGASSTASYVEYNNVANKPALVSASSQIDHDQTTNFVANEHIDHSTVSIGAGSGLSGGGDITTSRTLSLDTSSVHFLDGVKKELNTEGVFSSSAQVSYTGLSNIPSGIISSSTQINQLTGVTASYAFTSSLALENIRTASAAGSTVTFTKGDGSAFNVTIAVAETASYIDYGNISNKPNLISSSLQFNSLTSPFTGSFTGSFTGDGSGLTGIATNLSIAGDGATSDTVNLKTDTLTFEGSNGITSTVTNNKVTIAAPAGTVSSSAQIDVRQTIGIETIATTGSNTFTGVQTITNTTNSTDYTTGALIVQGGVGIAKDVNISGSLTVTGLLTAVSMSTLYVTSSEYTVGTSRIVLNDDDVVRFAGISVVDSGSTAGSGSLLWDSVKNHWIYENESGASYNSAILIAGPKHYGDLGNEEELIAGRVPVATGADHIDTNPASSSIYIDFSNRRTYIEAGLYVTGAITASAGFSGNGSGLTNVTATSVDYANVTNKPALVSSSLQFNNLSSPFTGSFTGSFTGDGSGLTGIATILAVSASDGAVTTGTVNLKTQAITYNAGEGIDISVSGQTVTIAGEDATTTNKGIASFTGSNFTVSSGQVTAKPINFNGTDLDLGGTYSFGLQNITPSGATTTDQVTLAGGAIINGVLFTSASVSSIGGPVSNQVIATVATASYDSAHFDYVIKDGTNFRTGTVMAVWGNGGIEFTDTSTNDIGNTLDEIFTVDLNSGTARLKFTSGTGTWTVKTAIRAL